MKSKIVIALLALIVLFQYVVIYSDKIDYSEDGARPRRQTRQEIMDGYERCITALDEAKFANHTDDVVWLKARQGCRDFWLLGKP